MEGVGVTVVAAATNDEAAYDREATMRSGLRDEEVEERPNAAARCKVRV